MKYSLLISVIKSILVINIFFLNSLLFTFHIMDGSLEQLLFQFVQSDEHLGEIRRLIQLGANPNYQTVSGLTPLHAAAMSHNLNTEVVQELIRSGAEVDLNDHLSCTALHFAVINRKVSVVDELLQSGASVNAKTFLGETPLHVAVSRFTNASSIFSFFELWIIRNLLQYEDIDCNAKDFGGNTPLMLAIKENKVEAVKLLLDKGADPNICNNDSESPLHVAFSLPRSSIVVQLLFNGASICAMDKKRQTPLDILLKNDLVYRTKKWIMFILKITVYKYSITNDIKRKVELFPQLSQFLIKSCNEVDHMRRDIISGKITMHDFLWDCFDENDFKYLLLQLHKPIVERLVRDIYPECFIEILKKIPDFSLFTILQMTACSKNRTKATKKVKNLADLFSILDIIYLFSNYLSNVEIFCLIVAFSDVIIAESLQNMHERDVFYLLD